MFEEFFFFPKNFLASNTFLFVPLKNTQLPYFSLHAGPASFAVSGSFLAKMSCRFGPEIGIKLKNLDLLSYYCCQTVLLDPIYLLNNGHASREARFHNVKMPRPVVLCFHRPKCQSYFDCVSNMLKASN